MRLSSVLAPRDREFFDLFEEAGRNIVQSGELLERLLDRWPDHGELAREIVIREQEGDRITHDIIQRLNQTFVTPIEREDILDLASALDDIVDFIEEVRTRAFPQAEHTYGIAPEEMERLKEMLAKRAHA